MRIAIVGGGVSGVVAAHLLHRQHEIVLYEAADYLGGHTNTIHVERDDGAWDVDTGFIVLNDRNYPNFNRILAEHRVEIQSTHMGFSVKGEDSDFEYAGTPTGVFAQRRNAVDPVFWRMLSDLVRFNRELPDLLESTDPGPSLGEWVEANGYSKAFVDRLIVPQASAVWSADPASMWSFPARFLAEFFSNHGMLGFRDRPQWQTIVGGSQTYTRALSAPFADRIRLSTPVTGIRRDEHGVDVQAGGSTDSLRRGHPRLPLRPGPAGARGPVIGRAPAPRRLPVSAQRGRPPYRSGRPAPPASDLAGLELSPLCRPSADDDSHLLHESSPEIDRVRSTSA